MVTPIISAIINANAHKLSIPIIILANVLAIFNMAFFLIGFRPTYNNILSKDSKKIYKFHFVSRNQSFFI